MVFKICGFRVFTSLRTPPTKTSVSVVILSSVLSEFCVISCTTSTFFVSPSPGFSEECSLSRTIGEAPQWFTVDPANQCTPKSQSTKASMSDVWQETRLSGNGSAPSGHGVCRARARNQARGDQGKHDQPDR